MMQQLSDIEVMLEYQKGNGSAMDELLRRYKHPVFSFCYRLLGNTHQAQDAAQEVFLKIHIHREGYVPQGKFTTWTFAIAHNICISLVRKRKWLAPWPRQKDQDDCLAELPDDSPSPEAEAHKREMQSHVQRCVNGLPFLQKEALILREYHSLSYEEIAATMHRPVNSVKSLVHRARMEIKEKLLPVLNEAERGQK